MAKEAKKKTSKKKSKGGRPTKFDKAQMLLIEYMAKEGKTDKEMAEAVGVTERTINNWKKDYPQYFQPLKDWKAEADEKVERALYQRATGYVTKDTKMFCHEGMIVAEDYEKHYPPDPTSMIFWLKNRNPQKWRDKIDVAQTGEININIDGDDSNL